MSGARAPVTLELPSEPGMGAVARAAVRAVLENTTGRKLDEREVDEIAVVVHEACTNAVRHAHAGDPTRRMRLEIVRHDDEIEIVVLDEGAPFALSDAAPPEPESLLEGGYGLHIMRAWMDEVTVRHDGRGNALRLVRRYRRAAVPEVARASGV